MTSLASLPAISTPLPWQEESWSQLGQQLGRGQLPHALLLVGPEHTGKARMALALARLLLCASPEGGLNCGKCHACELSASGSHGDFRWLEPEEKSRVIKIEQVRQLVDFTNRTAGFGLRKVVVLCPAESMNSSAANALLKSLEEPAADTYLLLVCDRLQGLPATIRSRCQMLRLAVPEWEQSLAWLDPITGKRPRSEALLDLAEGRPLLAAELHGSDGSDRLLAVRQALGDLLHGGKPKLPALAGLLAEDSLEQVLALLVSALQGELRGLGGEQLASASARAAFRLLDELVGIQRAVNAGSNPNRQLLIETLLAKVQLELGAGGLGDNIPAMQGGR